MGGNSSVSAGAFGRPRCVLTEPLEEAHAQPRMTPLMLPVFSTVVERRLKGVEHEVGRPTSCSLSALGTVTTFLSTLRATPWVVYA